MSTVILHLILLPFAMSTSEKINKVLNFWFGAPTDADYLQSRPFWYGNEEDDKLVKEVLADDHLKAKKGEYDDWVDSAEGAIALIILLDQVPRNIYRGTVGAYATDDKALDIAKTVIANGWDKTQPSIIRRYIYSPFNHSEDMSEQARSIELFTKLGDPEHLRWAYFFYDTVKKYGRFPHRDKVLGENCRNTPDTNTGTRCN